MRRYYEDCAYERSFISWVIPTENILGLRERHEIHEIRKQPPFKQLKAMVVHALCCYAALGCWHQGSSARPYLGWRETISLPLVFFQPRSWRARAGFGRPILSDMCHMTLIPCILPYICGKKADINVRNEVKGMWECDTWKYPNISIFMQAASHVICYHIPLGLGFFGDRSGGRRKLCLGTYCCSQHPCVRDFLQPPLINGEVN